MHPSAVGGHVDRLDLDGEDAHKRRQRIGKQRGADERAGAVDQRAVHTVTAYLTVVKPTLRLTFESVLRA